MPSPVATPHDGLETLFAVATRFDTLWAAWERVRANNGAAGGDGVTVAQFSAIAEGRLSHLSHGLRTGRYRPAPSRRVLIPKRSGGWRPLDIPAVVDRVAQAAVALTLSPVLDPTFEDASFAYRPGRSVADAVARVAKHRRDGFTWVVDGDIVRDFERVSHEALLTRLDGAIDAPELVDLIGLWLESYAPHGLGLPQGSPLSPLLANLYLDAVDEAIEGRGIRLVRFADDFVLLARTEAAAGDALARMRALLAGHGLELHAEKTRIVPFEQGFRFLGHLFVRSMVWREVGQDATPAEDAIAEAERAALLAQDPSAPLSSEPEGDAGLPVPGRFSARRRVLYVLEPGRRLTARGEAFAVLDGEATLLSLPQARVDRIELGAEVDFDPAALDLAAASDTDLVRVDGRGRTLARWQPIGPERGRRHLAQAALVLDPARRAALARILVTGRVFNQRQLLKRLDRSRRDPDVRKATVEIGRILRTLRRVTGPVETSMGLEGQAAALYWPALARLTDAWAFQGRRRRRSGEDPLNIAFDLLSSLLARDIDASVRRAGLHPGFGVLHAVTDGEDALVHDLIEEFRAPIAEACALSAVARKAFRAEHVDGTGPGRARVTREGWRVLVRAYEAWVARAIRDPQGGDETLWRGLFDRQADRLAAHAETGEPYRPYAMDY